MRSISKNRINRRGNRVGIWEHYYSDGNVHSKGIYVNGDREGIWEFYKESGELDYKFEYY